MEEDDDEDVAYRRRQKEHGKGKKRVDVTEGESSLGKRKADEVLKDERECGRPRMHGSSSKMTTAQPTLIHQPGSRMTTSTKATRPKRMMKAQQAAERRQLKERRDNIESEDEDPIGDATAGSTSSANGMVTVPTPCSPIYPTTHTNSCAQPHPTKARPSRLLERSQAPSEAPAPRSRCPSHATSSKRGTSVNTQPPSNPQDHPNVASSSTGIMLRIPPSQATLATTIRMESAPQTSAVKAPVNMGLVPGTAYSLGRNPLVSHKEHHTALQLLETMEGENRKLCGLIT
ncbi:hypothetical protein BDN67DRAFT_985058 [Paxillus ammoniavirescens]|nr:hypothetical protein BDN67DRAFT_985058 [Paxillus ammoniavirescens]